MRIFILSIISGILSYLAVSLPRFLDHRLHLSEDVLFLFPGLLFGVFILMPLVKQTPHRFIRRVSLVLFSIAAWYVAVSVGFQALPWAKQSPVLSCGLSGSAGALILAAASRYIVPIQIDLASVLTALLVAFLGGCVIGLAVAQTRASAAGESLYLFGFVLWQASVAISLFRRATAHGGSR